MFNTVHSIVFDIKFQAKLHTCKPNYVPTAIKVSVAMGLVVLYSPLMYIGLKAALKENAADKALASIMRFTYKYNQLLSEVHNPE